MNDTPPITSPMPAGRPLGSALGSMPRLLPLARFGVVFGWGLRRLFKTKKFAWTTGLALVLGGLAGYAISKSEDPGYSLWEFLGTSAIGICVPLIALALAAGGFGEEVSEQTLVFHLVRPVSRTTLFFARFVAGLGPALVASGALCVIATVISGVRVPASTTVLTLAAAGTGTVAVGAVYYSLAALFRRGLVAGLVYTLVIEGWFQWVPGSIQKLSLTHHVRSIFHRLCDTDFATLSGRVADEWERGNTAVIRTRKMREADLSGLVPAEPWSSVSNALLVCGIVAIVALLIGARTIRRKDFALKD